MGKEEEEQNRGRAVEVQGEKVRKEMVCSGGWKRILYALSVTCRSVLIIERGKVRAECKVSVRVCMCANRKEMQGVKPQWCPHFNLKHRGWWLKKKERKTERKKTMKKIWASLPWPVLKATATWISLLLNTCTLHSSTQDSSRKIRRTFGAFALYTYKHHYKISAYRESLGIYNTSKQTWVTSRCTDTSPGIWKHAIYSAR